MADKTDDNDENSKQVASPESKESSKVDKPQAPQESEKDLDLDEDLAEALGDVDGVANVENEEADVDKLLNEADPNFSSELEEIASTDFSNVVIEKNSAADEVDENSKAPSLFRAYLNNLPKDRKNRYLAAFITILVLVPAAILVFYGRLLPQFDLPFYLSMNELTQKVHVYDIEEDEIPLFDSFRNNTVTWSMPKAMINLRSQSQQPVYGQFEFFLVLRDKEVESTVKANETEILDRVQRILEQMSWTELKDPLGKERVKKVLRHQLNEYFQGNYVIGVYYRSVLLQK